MNEGASPLLLIHPSPEIIRLYLFLLALLLRIRIGTDWYNIRNSRAECF